MKTQRDSLMPAAAALFVGAAAWPTIASAVIDLTLSPYERALRSAWCGISAHAGAQFLGHCAVCWEGAAALAMAGALLLAARKVQTGAVLREGRVSSST